jgi:hypothetical protein
MTRGCWVMPTFSTRFDIPSCRPRGSRRSGVSATAERPSDSNEIDLVARDITKTYILCLDISFTCL